MTKRAWAIFLEGGPVSALSGQDLWKARSSDQSIVPGCHIKCRNILGLCQNLQDAVNSSSDAIDETSSSCNEKLHIQSHQAEGRQQLFFVELGESAALWYSPADSPQDHGMPWRMQFGLVIAWSEFTATVLPRLEELAKPSSYAPLSFTFFSRLPDPAFNVALLLIGKSPSLQTSGTLHRLDRRLRDLAFVLKTMRLEEAQNLTIIDVPDKEQVWPEAATLISVRRHELSNVFPDDKKADKLIVVPDVMAALTVAEKKHQPALCSDKRPMVTKEQDIYPHHDPAVSENAADSALPSMISPSQEHAAVNRHPPKSTGNPDIPAQQMPVQTSLRRAPEANGSSEPVPSLEAPPCSLPDSMPAHGSQSAISQQLTDPHVTSSAAPQQQNPSAGPARVPSNICQQGTAGPSGPSASAPFDASQSVQLQSAPTAGQVSASPSYHEHLSLSADTPADQAHTNHLQDRPANSAQASDIVPPFRTGATAAAVRQVIVPRPSPLASSGIESVPGLPPAGQDDHPPLSRLKGISAATPPSMPAAAPDLHQVQQKAPNHQGTRAAATNDGNTSEPSISSALPAQSANHPDKQAQLTCPGSVQGVSTSAGPQPHVSAPVKRTTPQSPPDTVLAQGTAPAMAAAHQSSEPPSLTAPASHQNHLSGKADAKSALRLPSRADLPAQPTSRPSMPTLTHGSAAAAGPSTFTTSGATKGGLHQSSAVPARTQQPADVPRVSHAAQTLTKAPMLTQNGAAAAGAGTFAGQDLPVGPPSHRNPTQQAGAQLPASVSAHIDPASAINRPQELMQHQKLSAPASAAANAPSDTAPATSQREYPLRLSRAKQSFPIRDRHSAPPTNSLQNEAHTGTAVAGPNVTSRLTSSLQAAREQSSRPSSAGPRREAAAPTHSPQLFPSTALQLGSSSSAGPSGHAAATEADSINQSQGPSNDDLNNLLHPAWTTLQGLLSSKPVDQRIWGHSSANETIKTLNAPHHQADIVEDAFCLAAEMAAMAAAHLEAVGQLEEEDDIEDLALELQTYEDWRLVAEEDADRDEKTLWGLRQLLSANNPMDDLQVAKVDRNYKEGRVRKLQNQFLYWAAAEAGSRAEVKIDEAARRMDLGLPCSEADLHGNASQVGGGPSLGPEVQTQYNAMVERLGQLPIPAEPESWLLLRATLRDTVMQMEQQLTEKVSRHRYKAETCQRKLDGAAAEPEQDLEESDSEAESESKSEAESEASLLEKINGLRFRSIREMAQEHEELKHCYQLAASRLALWTASAMLAITEQELQQAAQLTTKQEFALQCVALGRESCAQQQGRANDAARLQEAAAATGPQNPPPSPGISAGDSVSGDETHQQDQAAEQLGEPQGNDGKLGPDDPTQLVCQGSVGKRISLATRQKYGRARRKTRLEVNTGLPLFSHYLESF